MLAGLHVQASKVACRVCTFSGSRRCRQATSHPLRHLDGFDINGFMLLAIYRECFSSILIADATLS
ncbi:hypothetical protein ACPOL_3819 [Acidisarcina polymorpha]|uniref:Uncharacterized protein n=1 Tax=Acidisarcina polymorpha TaxID=2211140 RepID=A0A2Z5G1Z7_9BACT|nr:hypothetical protein ACPOL_3819 [Acidisarcina polymorpha]